MASDAKSPADLVRAHVPVLPPRWIRNVPRVEDHVLDSFRKFSVPDISDAVGPLYTMAPGIRPLYEPINRLTGRALTVKAPPGDSLTVHGAISVCQPGDVLVIDWRGHVESCSGGAGMLVGPIRTGLAGIVVDGAWRDIPDLQTLDFPIFGRGICSVSRAKTQLGEINVPICCGGVIVNAGDVIVADVEGVVVVPRDAVESVAEHVAQRSAGARGPRVAHARAPETEPQDRPDALADHLERRAAAHYGDAQARVPRSEIFANVFAAAGGVASDWNGSSDPD
jgi:4-hydroxy-4-methyl-2-oxoglutarate aldolase